ncbi:MAG: thioredoxin [Buchnera aphidicola (Nurudea shiraii)]
MQENIINLTKENFHEQVFNSDRFVLVDFWADWCNPCKLLIPILEEISKEYSDRLLVSKINIDSYPSIASKYSVKSIPTLLLFNKGEVISTKIGALSKYQLKNFLDIYLK